MCAGQPFVHLGIWGNFEPLSLIMILTQPDDEGCEISSPHSLTVSFSHLMFSHSLYIGTPGNDIDCIIWVWFFITYFPIAM